MSYPSAFDTDRREYAAMLKLMYPPPTTPEGWCRLWHKLDKRYDTAPDSPLHHDARCLLCELRKLGG